MVNNIPELLRSRKAINLAFVLIIILLGVLSFGLGRLSALQGQKATILECPKIEVENKPQIEGVSTQKVVLEGQYVASKNGTKYHFPWCSGAKRILEENKIYFETKTEAERAGYTPASNCKGL